MTGESTILVADDEPDLRLLVKLLADGSFDVLEAADGQEAVDLIAARRDIDILLLDIRMPVLDGFGVLERLETLKLLDQLNVIAFSAHAERSMVERIMAHGVRTFLPKPFTADELAQALDAARPSAH